MNMTVGTVWNAVSADLYTPAMGIMQTGLNQDQVFNRVYRVRRPHYGGDIHGVGNVLPLSLSTERRCSPFNFTCRWLSISS